MKRKFLFSLLVFIVLLLLVLCFAIGVEINSYICGKKIFSSLSEFVSFNAKTTIIAVFSFLISMCSFFVAYQTNINTQSLRKVQNDKQILIFLDIIRHLYRNKVILEAIRCKLEKPERLSRYYPSEEHILKMKVLPEDLNFEKFSIENKKYNDLHKFALECRNLDTEIDIAVQHFTDKKISVGIKKRDLDFIDWRMQFLTVRVLNIMSELYSKNSIKNNCENFCKTNFKRNRVKWIEKKREKKMQKEMIVCGPLDFFCDICILNEKEKEKEIIKTVRACLFKTTHYYKKNRNEINFNIPDTFLFSKRKENDLYDKLFLMTDALNYDIAYECEYECNKEIKKINLIKF